MSLVHQFMMNVLFPGVGGFFVKHVKTGMCVNDTSKIQSRGSYGSLSYAELTNNCLDPAAQFRFRDNGAMLNLKRQGCLSGHFKHGSGYYLDMFYIYVDAVSLDRSACAQRPNKKIYRAITQTSWGGLSVYYKGRKRSRYATWCAVPKTHEPLATKQGIDPYIGLTTNCNDAKNKRFNFGKYIFLPLFQTNCRFLFLNNDTNSLPQGSVTCHGKKVENANCPKDQYMVVKTASYRGLSTTKTCGLSDDHSCDVDVTSLVKKQCDGQYECSITVDNNLFSDHLCPGLTKYFYFEYQCASQSKAFKEPCGKSLFVYQ